MGEGNSGGASTVKEPGHFEVRKSSSQVTRMHLFLPKSRRPFLPQNTGRQRRFTVKIKQIKRSDMVTFLFSVHTITEAKQYEGLGRAEPGLEPGRWIFQPGQVIWCSVATEREGTEGKGRAAQKFSKVSACLCIQCLNKIQG